MNLNYIASPNSLKIGSKLYCTNFFIAIHKNYISE